MAHVSDLIATDIDQYLKLHETKSLLRFITCGSVGDGKSTLIERLLIESKMLFEDPLAALEADSKKVGTRGGDLDDALLLDGLAAEREQGITIDVAYRYFSTDRRKFIVADTPGHEQYTRNMITGASTADLAIILIDARKGMQVQTRRHSYLVSLIGIRHVVLAVNKMDLVDYSQDVFDTIAAQYREFAEKMAIAHVSVMPISGVNGDNIVQPSPRTPWYTGPTLMGLLETVEIDETRLQKQPLRLPVQWVHRPNLDLRGFAGTIAGGVVKPGQRVRVQPSGRESTVARIVTAGGDLDRAVAGQSITLTLTDEVDISRGDVICGIADLSNNPVAAGMLDFALRRADNIHWQAVEVDKQARRRQAGHGSAVVWLTGLSGAGKSALANMLEKRLHTMGKRTYLLDGDNVRLGLNKDLGFTAADRVENIRRVAEVARLMVDAGVIVITAFISPFRAERRMARELMGAGEFIEVFVDTPLAVAEQRDPKGLYRKARRGELKNFTGIDSPYEAPEHAEVRIDTTCVSVEAASEQLLQMLTQLGVLELP